MTHGIIRLQNFTKVIHRIHSHTPNCWYYTKRILLSFHSLETNCSVFLQKIQQSHRWSRLLCFKSPLAPFLNDWRIFFFFPAFFHHIIQHPSHTFITEQNEKANLLQKQTPIFSEHILFLRRCPQSLSKETPPTHTKGAPIFFWDSHSPNSLSWRFSQGFGRKKKFS